jgi:predicted ATPase
MTTAMHDRFVLIAGCSGGGKSSLLAELHARGHAVVAEPGRRIVQHELNTGGRALPWIDPEAFARRAITTALADRKLAKTRPGWVFFDRGLIDAASALEQLRGKPLLKRINALHPYHRRVFLAPPWAEIYVKDAERRHDFEAGLAEYARLKKVLPALGYEVIILPKAPVFDRAAFVLSMLGN